MSCNFVIALSLGFMSGAEGHGAEDLDVEVMPKGSQLLDGIAGKVLILESSNKISVKNLNLMML